VAFEARHPACGLNPQALSAALARAFLEAGLPLAMGLGKTPRPMVHLAHPLPLDVPGREEWADIGFFRAPELPVQELPPQVNGRAPEGLRVLRCAFVPNYASPVPELCRAAKWLWPCPAGAEADARGRVAAFLAADSFQLEKAGKTGGHKGVKCVEIRPLVESMAWGAEGLEMVTRVDAGSALNPRKLLGAVLGVEPAQVLGLERTGLLLAEDPRLSSPERFEPKLHNMYEDAVLLDSAPGVSLVEGDEDDTIVLGG
jgi:radical SAM-linked protein